MKVVSRNISLAIAAKIAHDMGEEINCNELTYEYVNICPNMPTSQSTLKIGVFHTEGNKLYHFIVILVDNNEIGKVQLADTTDFP